MRTLYGAGKPKAAHDRRGELVFAILWAYSVLTALGAPGSLSSGDERCLPRRCCPHSISFSRSKNSGLVGWPVVRRSRQFSNLVLKLLRPPASFPPPVLEPSPAHACSLVVVGSHPRSLTTVVHVATPAAAPSSPGSRCVGLPSRLVSIDRPESCRSWSR
jgi:hypothetical protein